MTLPPYCHECGTYHEPQSHTLGGPARRSRAVPSPQTDDHEVAWGWVALIVLGVLAALAVGWC